MPKAPRDNESTTPKKRTRKAASKNGNGVHAENGNGAAEVTVTPQVIAQTARVEMEATPNVEEQIRVRAYELFLQRGANGNGSALQDWLRAKEEICGRQNVA